MTLKDEVHSTWVTWTSNLQNACSKFFGYKPTRETIKEDLKGDLYIV